MKTLKRQTIGFSVAGIVLLLAIVALVVVNRQRSEAANREKEIVSIGAEWEESGRMPQADYIKLRHLIGEVQSNGGRLSDSDLEWSLAMLKNGSDAISRSRVLGLLGLLGQHAPLPSVQKEKVLAAITPFLTSSEELDQRYAVRVEKNLKNR